MSGKIILFGEHAVVHGKTAIAASVGLRTYLLVNPQTTNITLDFPDIQLKSTWKIEDLPWNKVARCQIAMPPTTLDSELLDAIASIVHTGDSIRDHASQAFLYLYMCLAKEKNGLVVILRSALPVGAGLGSSAAVSVCIASALLLFNNHNMLPGHKGSVDVINKWAFLGERVIHGNPSGIDNTVSTFGGAVVFRKGSMEALHSFKSLRFLLIDTRIKRNTKLLVANVGKKLEEYPAVVGPILDSIDGISLECRRLLTDTSLSRDHLLLKLQDLIDYNHHLLSSLPVSHEAIHLIRDVAMKEGVHVKLTGAGGGGCCVGLLRDDYPEERVHKLKVLLEKEQFEEPFRCFEAKVGDHGVGVAMLTSTSTVETSLLQLEKDQLGDKLSQESWSYYV